MDSYPTEYPTYDPTLYTQTTPAADPMIAAIAAVFSGTFLIFFLILLVVIIIAFWKIFTKAGKPGWAALIPIYNIWVLLEVVKRPGWWLLLYFVPFVNFVIIIIVSIDLAKVFGKDAVYGVLLNFFLSPIGQLILGFSGAKYTGKR